jgi:hypothetical protein
VQGAGALLERELELRGGGEALRLPRLATSGRAATPVAIHGGALCLPSGPTAYRLPRVYRAAIRNPQSRIPSYY